MSQSRVLATISGCLVGCALLLALWVPIRPSTSAEAGTRPLPAPAEMQVGGVRKLGDMPELGADAGGRSDSPQATTTASPPPTALASPTLEGSPTATPTTGSRLTVINVPASVSADTIWAAGNTYLVSGVTTVNAGVVLTIQPGSILKFQNSGGTRGKLLVNGRIMAQGSAAARIVFTSVADDSVGGDANQNGDASWPVAGDWDGVDLTSTSGGSVLEYVNVAYAGTGGAALRVTGASVQIVNSTVRESSGDGVRYWNGAGGAITANHIDRSLGHGLSIRGASAPAVGNNTLSHNRQHAVHLESNSFPVFSGNAAYSNATNGIAVFGTIGTGTWSANLPYVATQDLTVEQGSTLTLSPGAVVKLDAGRDVIIRGALTVALNTVLTVQAGTVIKFNPGGRIVLSGRMTANGTGADRIIFTSVKDDSIAGDTNGNAAANAPAAGDWESIRFASSAGASVLDYVTVRYGGSNSATGALFLDGSAPSLGHLIVMGSQYRGLYGQNSSAAITDAVFSQNDIGMYNGTTAFMTVTDSDLYSNPNYGLLNANAGHSLDATDNWWGNANGSSTAAIPAARAIG
jgi:hypothetical protein